MSDATVTMTRRARTAIPVPETGLPVEAVLDELRAALAAPGLAVLEAPPGAGKTTVAPLALLGERWLGDKRIVMLEPRRLAARMAARRMAALLGEEVGGTIGYRVRMDSRVGPDTRLEVVTEGILTRRLLDDPELAGVGAVIFDEFHERSIHTDLGLALCLETRAAFREDLRLLVMSATLDGARVASLLGGAPEIRSEGRAHAVETRHVDRPDARDLARATASATLAASREERGGILVFLPGEREIRAAAALLQDGGLPADVRVAPLYGALSPTDQDSVIRPAPAGARKIVLATDIAETSLTIEGVRVVVDCGYRRVPRFDAASGMTRLETRRISRAAAEQRRGRAGRTEPGVCYRLWPEAETTSLPAFETPEILRADLAPLVLDLARWGVSDPAQLAWPDAPPAGRYEQARELLREIGAVGRDGRITPHGEAMGGLPLHPRLAHMLIRGRELGQGALACDIAALLEERDFLARQDDSDLRSRLEVLRGTGVARSGGLERARKVAEDLRRRLRVGRSHGGDVGELLALAYPDRLARRRGAGGRYLLRNGRGAVLPEGDRLGAAEWLAVASLGGTQAADARIRLAAPLTPARVEALFADDLEEADAVQWDTRQEKVVAARTRRLGAIVLRHELLADPPAEAVRAAMLDGVRRMGLGCLPWSDGLRQWQARVSLVRRLGHGGLEWPDVSDAALYASLDAWLPPFLSGMRSRADLARLELGAALAALLDWPRPKLLQEAAPTHFTAPTGSRLRLDYVAPDGPVLRVPLQEMLGVAETPTVAGGEVAVLVVLLSPAGRPLQTTRDLAEFWRGSYAQVKAEMKGRYPKHYWPDDPLSATPTKRTKKAMDRDR